jgi:hypothetical protein
MAGIPTSSANPVSGKADGEGVEVGVNLPEAASVNKAATVAVRSIVGVTNTSVAVATLKVGDELGLVVAVGGSELTVGVFVNWAAKPVSIAA